MREFWSDTWPAWAAIGVVVLIFVILTILIATSTHYIRFPEGACQLTSVSHGQPLWECVGFPKK